ncbi:hypothetical protein [Amnibacterium sp.]|uniref:hypothetical protein n=1 Tax=Amnibacterium sp. TaxID=1872496 RepID=UPI00262C4D8F|nr:hypothetical protein [Amnibacterium sp.]MCU1472443.1 hypothetical protein [Amnibacterium sp.]
MTARLTVSASSDADSEGRIGQALAALPMSLHPGGEDADLVGLAGGTDWVSAAVRAIDAGARGVLVVDPTPAEVRALRGSTVPVVLDGRWTYNPAVLDSVSAFTARNDAESLIEVRADVPVGSDLDRVLLSQLALIRTAIAPVVELSFDRCNSRGWDARGTLESGARVALAAILTDALEPAASLRIIKPDDAVRLTVPDPATARPGHVVVSSAGGATLLVTKWESAHRVAWRTLHRLVTSEQLGTDLLGFEHDVELVRGGRTALSAA